MKIFRSALPTLYVIAGTVMFAIINSCNIINPDENAPTYISVDKVNFDATPTAQELGPSTSVKIKDVWVYVDNDFVGAYELPAHFPILKSGQHKVLLSPGILLNGIASTRSPYPFYNAFEQDVDFQPNGTVVLNPVVHYFDNVECTFCESFEGSGFSLTATGSSDTIMYQLPAGDPNIFEGSSSGVVILDSSHTKFEVASTVPYSLPGSGQPVYLELDYKINQIMQVGLFVEFPNSPVEQVPVINLNPTDTWNKIYIQLGYTVSTYASSASGFKIYFGAVKDPSVSNPAFYIDNIKLVHN